MDSVAPLAASCLDSRSRHRARCRGWVWTAHLASSLSPGGGDGSLAPEDLPHVPKTRPKTVREYIAAAPKAARKQLRAIRAVLKKAAPRATETLKWGTPVLEEKRILFSYSAHKSHLNFMPTGPALVPFKRELAKYKTGKDTVQFTYDKPLPKALIRRIATYRVKQVKVKDARWMY